MSIEQQPNLSHVDSVVEGAEAPGRSGELWWRQSASVRDLIAELAQVEEALQRIPSFLRRADGHAAINPEMVRLLDRERRVIRTLRGRRILSSRAEAGPGGLRRGLDGSW